MNKTIVRKIIEAHLVSGVAVPGNEIGIKIDQTLTQDATGTMAYLQLESMNVPLIKTELSINYIDHNTVQIGFENADDHRYLKSIAQKYGIYLSRAGNGICHQVHLERFGTPGKTLRLYRRNCKKTWYRSSGIEESQLLGGGEQTENRSGACNP